MASTSIKCVTVTVQFLGNIACRYLDLRAGIDIKYLLAYHQALVDCILYFLTFGLAGTSRVSTL